jgi:hypothetical protein
MMMDGIVSDSAVLTACIDELTVRSPRSVLDVVKSISEMVGRQAAVTSQLLLNDKAGVMMMMLLLEKHPTLFTIANKTNSNPLIFLCSRLSVEELDSLSKGVIPPQYQNYLSDTKVNNSPTFFDLCYSTYSFYGVFFQLVESPHQMAVQPQRQIADLHMPQSRNVNESRILPRVTNSSYDDLNSFQPSNSSASASMFSGGGSGIRLESGNTGMFFSDPIQPPQGNRFASAASTLSASAPAWPPTNNSVSIPTAESRRSQQFSSMASKLTSSNNNSNRGGFGGSFHHSSMESVDYSRQGDSGINFDRANLAGLRSDALSAPDSFHLNLGDHNYYEETGFPQLSRLGNSIDFSLGSHQQDAALPSRFSESFGSLMLPTKTQFPNPFRNESTETQHSVIASAALPMQQQYSSQNNLTIHGPGTAGV